MKIALLNQTARDVEGIAWHLNPQGGGYKTPEPFHFGTGAEITIEGDDVATVDIGYNPSAVEELRAAITDATTAFAAIIRRILDRSERSDMPAGDVIVRVENIGTESVRVIPELNVEALELAPGNAMIASGAYVEVRQLGM